ncbi:MAG: rhomboid family intramembrane serine protease [Candidatus Lokiarchaeota archaeon]|nr:rhomboid family intramembrane serine protease [Candidatus Lokiarchaeota archaeon]
MNKETDKDILSKIPLFTILICILLFILHYLRSSLSPIFPNFEWGLINFNVFFNGRVYGVITYAFMHFTWIHLLFNLSQILIFGYMLEKKLRLIELLGLFFISILVGGILSLILVGLLDPQWFFMGSSGFGNGFLGCAWMLSIKQVKQNNHKRLYNDIFFYFYLFSTIFFAILPIVNVIFELDEILYVLLNLGIMFIHLFCVFIGMLFGFFIYGKIKSRGMG